MRNNQDRWTEFEHNRLATVLDWPESPFKRATLDAIVYTLESLSFYRRHPNHQQKCPQCRTALRAFARHSTVAAA